MGFQDDLQQIADDTQLLHDYVHGGAGDYVTTEGGTYPSLGESADQIQDAVDSLTALNPRGAWTTSTAYLARELAEYDGIVYICLSAHTSGVFATDLAALRWAVYQGPGKILSASVTYTVGTGGDFPNINDALSFVSEYRPVYTAAGVTVVLSLLSGFVVDEQVICTGIDLSWIVIRSVDASVSINSAGLTLYFAASAITGSALYPVFAAINGGRTPVIDTIFAFSAVSPYRIGALAMGAGSVIQAIDGGFNLAHMGVVCCYGGLFSAGSMECDGGSIYEADTGFYAAAGGMITGSSLEAPNNQVGVYAKKGGSVHATNITAGDCYNGINAVSGDVLASIITANSCGNHGVFCQAGRVQASTIHARMGASDSSDDIAVEYGGIVSRTSGIGGTSQATGTMTANGYISA